MPPTPNLGSLPDAQADTSRLALIDCRDAAAPREYTLAELDALANACGRGLLARGHRPGDRIAILSGNRAEFLIAYLGILRAGMEAVLVNPRFAAATIAFVLRDAAVTRVLSDAPRRTVDVGALPRTDFDAEGADSFSALLDAGPLEAHRPTAETVAMVLYTSGSTGRPKGVPLTHAGHGWALRERIKAGPFPQHRMLVAAPLFHMNALCNALCALCGGMSLVLLPEFTARGYLEAAARHRCTWITSVPTMMAMALLEKELLASLDLSAVTVVRMGSAPVSAKLWARIHETFPRAGIRNGYGTTETGPWVFAGTDGDVPPDTSVGRPVAGVEVKLVDEQGREGDQGVLWQRTPATMSGYLNLPTKTSEVLTPDGWYISGDVFRRDAAGYYFFVGRADDMFSCGGENIYPGEVESVLMTHPHIEQCCVVPVPDEIKGGLPVAFIVPTPGAAPDPQEVRQFVLARAPAYQHPRMVTVVQALPLAGPGKVDRVALRAEAERMWQQTERGQRRRL